MESTTVGWILMWGSGEKLSKGLSGKSDSLTNGWNSFVNAQVLSYTTFSFMAVFFPVTITNVF